VLLLLPAVLCLLFAPAIEEMLWAAGLSDLLIILLTFVDAELAARTRITLTRRLPTRLSVGTDNEIIYLVENLEDRPLEIRLHDQIPDSFVAKLETVDASLSPSTTVALRLSLRPQSRGRFAFGGVSLRVRGPLGLAYAERLFPQAIFAKVYPDIRATRLLLAGGARDLAKVGMHLLRREGEGTEIEALRDYVPGDDFRDIDWRATARRERPIIRVGRPERSQTLFLAVDCSRLMAVHAGELTKLDQAIQAALLTAFVALRGDDRVGVMLFADELYGLVPPGKGQAQYHRILELLYAARPTRTFVDYRSFARNLLAHQKRRALVMILTELHDDATTRPLMDQVRMLATRHLPVVLTMRDPKLEAAARAAPESAIGTDGSFQMAAAAELLAERAALARGLSSAGARIIDSLPEESVLAAVNAYVQIKRKRSL